MSVLFTDMELSAVVRKTSVTFECDLPRRFLGDGDSDGDGGKDIKKLKQRTNPERLLNVKQGGKKLKRASSHSPDPPRLSASPNPSKISEISKPSSLPIKPIMLPAGYRKTRKKKESETIRAASVSPLPPGRSRSSGEKRPRRKSLTTSRRSSLKSEKLKADGREESVEDVKEDSKKAVPTVIVSLPETMENVTVERDEETEVASTLLQLQDNIRKFEENVEAQVLNLYLLICLYDPLDSFGIQITSAQQRPKSA